MLGDLLSAAPAMTMNAMMRIQTTGFLLPDPVGG
jgi:hypothetical protein